MKYELVSHYPSAANAPLWTVVIKSRLSNIFSLTRHLKKNMWSLFSKLEQYATMLKRFLFCIETLIVSESITIWIPIIMYYSLYKYKRYCTFFILYLIYFNTPFNIILLTWSRDLWAAYKLFNNRIHHSKFSFNRTNFEWFSLILNWPISAIIKLKGKNIICVCALTFFWNILGFKKVMAIYKLKCFLYS